MLSHVSLDTGRERRHIKSGTMEALPMADDTNLDTFHVTAHLSPDAILTIIPLYEEMAKTPKSIQKRN